MSIKQAFDVEYFYENYDLEEELTIPQFEEMAEPLIEKAIAVAESALGKAGLEGADLNGILLAGGTSQMPLVKELLEQRLRCAATIVPKDLMWLIAKGAAIHHRDLMTRPKEATRLILGADLFLETFTQGRLGQTLLVPSHQTLPHSFSREFPVNSDVGMLTIQLLTESGTHSEGLLRLDRREINVTGMGLSKIGVKVAIDKNKSITISVTDPKTKIPLDNVEIAGDLLNTPEEIKAARRQYGFLDIAPRSGLSDQRVAVGIDLGTTTCEAVIWDLGKQSFAHGMSEPLLSQVLIRPNGTVNVENLDVNTDTPGYFENFKVHIGSEVDAQKYRAHGKQWPPEILSGHLLATVWQKLQATYGAKTPLSEAVITVPSDFSEDQMALVQNAARIAGIERPVLLTEPVSAFLAYADAYPAIRKLGQTFLVFDFGGGTTDVGIIETKAANQVNTLASSGNNSIGGKDLTFQIATTIVEHFIENNGLALKKPDRERLCSRLFRMADGAKVSLSMELAGEE